MIGQYLATDTETGGVTSGVSLLTVYFAVLDASLNVIDELQLKLKPSDGIYHVTGEALGVNRIDLVEHDKAAITKSEAGALLYNFLNKHSPQGATKLIPVGHNVAFDLQIIYSELLNKQTMQRFVSYRMLDTGVIAQFLKLTDVIPEEVSGGLGSLVKLFGVEQREAHNEKADTLMTVDVLKAMTRVVENMRVNGGSPFWDESLWEEES